MNSLNDTDCNMDSITEIIEKYQESKRYEENTQKFNKPYFELCRQFNAEGRDMLDYILSLKDKETFEIVELATRQKCAEPTPQMEIEC